MKLNQSIYYLFTIILIMIVTRTNAAITHHSANNTVQDSVVLMIKKESGMNHIKYAFQKGDKIVYRDVQGKHKVEIIGFKGNQIIAKDLKKETIMQLDISKIESIQAYNENEIIGTLSFLGISGIVLSFMGNYSVKNASPSGCSFSCFSGISIFIMLVVLFFLPAAFLVWLIAKWILRRKRPLFSRRDGFYFEMKG